MSLTLLARTLMMMTTTMMAKIRMMAVEELMLLGWCAMRLHWQHWLTWILQAVDVVTLPLDSHL